MYRALYRKWRPKTFDEIVGQDHITSILKKQCEEDKVSHAYLFCGSRGTGKTSSAKILAKAVNCEQPINGNPCNECYSCRSIDNATATDVLEIDAASNNRVADVRELIDEVTYPPSMLKKRVYIIDEVHMLSDSAFNALLKTLEEPPEYVLFVLATTELNQLPSTIISRCMRFDFKRIEPDVLTKRLQYVCEHEGINITEKAERLISKLADGAARDALSLLDACSAGREDVITLEDVQTQLGITNNDTIINLFSAIVNRNIPEALGIIAEVHKSSKDLSVFMVDLISFVRDMLIAKSIPSESEKYLKEQFFFSASASDKLGGLIKAFTTESLLYYSTVLEEALNTISRFTVNKKTFFELTVIKLCDLSLSESPKALLARLAELEKRVSDGTFTVNTTSPAAQKPSIAPIPDAPVEKEQKPSIEPIPSDTDEKPFKAFPEFIQEIKNHPDICSFVRMAKMTEKGDEVNIYTDLLGKNILSQPAAKAILEGAIRTVTGKAKQVIVKEKTGKEDNTRNLIDEIQL